MAKSATHPAFDPTRVARVRTKICGITRPEDAVLAAQAGCDAIGLVFYEPSPRAVTIEQAIKITAALPPFVSVVALFVDASAEFVSQAIKALPLSQLQFHGNETAEYCEQFERPYMKAIRVKADTDFDAITQEYASASALLLDSYKAGVPGGTGETFNWDLIPQGLALPIVLAGGLNADNVADAVASVKPFAVDVSGGVEASKGIKDTDKMNAFVQQVNVQ